MSDLLNVLLELSKEIEKEPGNQFGKYFNQEIPSDLVKKYPEGSKGKSVFGVDQDGSFKIVMPYDFDPNHEDDRVQLGHELYHYYQALKVRDEMKAQMLRKALDPESANVPDPKVPNEKLIRRLDRHSKRHETEAMKFERRISKRDNRLDIH